MGGHGGGLHRYPQQLERPDGKKILDRISQEMGDRLFEVSKKRTVDGIYSQVSEELRNQYILGYAPQKDQSGPRYHKIQLTTKQRGADGASARRLLWRALASQLWSALRAPGRTQKLLSDNERTTRRRAHGAFRMRHRFLASAGKVIGAFPEGVVAEERPKRLRRCSSPS
jgi:hypothetical protein